MTGHRPSRARGERPVNDDLPVSRSLPPEAQQRVRELDAERDPLSLAEQISHELQAEQPGSSTPLPTIARAPTFAELQKLSDDQLKQTAVAEHVASEGLSRSELIFQLLKSRLKNNGLMFGEGTLEVLSGGYGFLRNASNHYLSSPEDIYVSPSQVRRFGLQTGSQVAGQIRPPKSTERYFALLRVEAVNLQQPEQAARTKPFEELTPLHPNQRIIMETQPDIVETRVVDLVAPIGFGQRGLIVSPPRAGKTLLMQKLARAVLKNYPQAYVIMLLVDERPEEVTDMLREVRGKNCEVISSTFDESAARHTQVAYIALEKAKRMVEHGTDVIIFLDSITRFARAWNSHCQQSGKLLSGGLDANALQRPKAFFGSARKVEEGGSLTIIATALVDTGSRMDEVIFEEFKGTGNLEIVLDRSLVDQRIWPAIDINASGTRRDEILMQADEHQRVTAVRRLLSEMNPSDAMKSLVDRLAKTKSNAEFLMNVRT
ncbi:MAG: transcription termination factor Rho [Pirellulaceae bacterium]|nr:transcription termination factor Rho [Pirellulaceae bacterium]